MSLYLPADVRAVSSLPRHPYYNDKFRNFVVFIDGEEVNGCVVADERNGYVKWPLTLETKLNNRRRSRKQDYTRRKGKVQIFIRKDTSNVH